jgi:hypothetical protein
MHDLISDLKFALTVYNWAQHGPDYIINIPANEDDLEVVKKIADEYGYSIGSKERIEEHPEVLGDELFYRVTLVE